MNTETVLTHILPRVTQMLKALVTEVEAMDGPSLYVLEERTQELLPQVGQVVLQALVEGQGSGLEGPERACACGGRQAYHDRSRPVSATTSLGVIKVAQRAYYTCPRCGVHSVPLDEQLGLGSAGRMSRYLQEQCGWLLALLPAQLARQTLMRFGWPAIAASQVREHGEALGAELEQGEQRRRVEAQAAVARPPVQQGRPRQLPESDRLYAAPDGVMYCTTTRDAQTGKAIWRELKVAAVYERAAAGQPGHAGAGAGAAEADGMRETVRQRVVRWLATQPAAAGATVASADQAVRVTYVAETGAWQDFGLRLWAELWARGLGRPVRALAVVADGSEHIDQAVESELRLPGIQLTRILDIAHAQQHLWTVAKTAFGEGSAQANAWVQPRLAALERGQVPQLLAALEQLADHLDAVAAPAGRTARQAAAYFAQRRDQIAYPAFITAGYQIGSGLAESACKRFGTDRMKGAGMRWTVAGAQAVATLRMLVLSDRWHEVTNHCRQAA